MATLIATADGNLTGSTTFAAAEAGAGALALNRNSNSTFVAAGTSTSTTFTVTTGKVIDAVLLWVRQTTTGAIGTLKIDLQKGGVSQASVTVNKTDLPTADVAIANIGPVLFKLTGTATGDGAANWTLVATTTGAGTVDYRNTGVANTWVRALRTTTTQTPAAADDLYIIGELTGAGTHNSRTVTMDSTAATVYGNGTLNTTANAGGGVHISNWGTLTYAGAGGTSYATLDGTPSNATLSNGNLTVTHSNTTVPAGGRSAMYKTSGKYYFEVTVTSFSGKNSGISVMPPTANYNHMSAFSDGVTILVDTTYWSSTNIFANGSNTFRGARPIALGNVVCVAVDMDNKKLWARVNGGQWNSATGNPATNTDGVDIPSAGGGHAPMLVFDEPGGGAGENFTINFGQTAYAQTPPAGFGNWGVTAASGGNYILRVAGDVVVYQYGTLNMGSSAATVFTPASLTGLIGWWDASVTASLSLTGADINSVADQSGLGNTLTNNGNSKPVYSATGFNSLKPAFVFNGTPIQCLMATPFPLGTGNTLTLWLVTTMPGAGTAQYGRYFSYIGSGGGQDFSNANHFLFAQNSFTATQCNFFRNSVQITSSTLTAHPAPHRLIVTVSAAGAVTIYSDGVSVGTGTSGGNWVNGGNLRIGNDPGLSSQLVAPIAECGIATGYHDATMVAELDLYLKTKWGL